MTAPSLTGSFSSPLVTAMADTPVRFMDGAAFVLNRNGQHSEFHLPMPKGELARLNKR